MAYSGMRVDGFHGGIEFLRRDPGGDQAGGIAEAAGVENRADLADHARFLQRLHPRECFVAGHAGAFPEFIEGALHKRQVFLQDSQQFRISGIGGGIHHGRKLWHAADMRKAGGKSAHPSRRDAERGLGVPGTFRLKFPAA